MEKNLLTVKEFADLAGVSVQSIYKKLGKANNPIQRYLKVVDGVKYIERRAYAILYSSAPAPTAAEEAPPAIVEEQTPPQPGESEAPPPKSSTDRILDILEQQLEEQRRQLQEKDKQIAAQADQINSLLARLEESSQIINQQQQLTAMNVKALSGGESKEEPAAVDVEPQPQPQPEEKQTTPPPPPPEKKGFFSFFKRKDKR